MAAVGRFFGRFFGRTIGEAAGFGIGGALERPIEPLLQELTNQTWRTSTVGGITRPLDAADAAEIVAEDVELREWGADQAAQGGIGGEQFDALLGAVLNAPGLGELFEAWRRDLIADADFTHGLRKAKLEPRWDAALKALKERLLSLDQLANAVVQGHMSMTAATAEAGELGYSAARFAVLVENTGLPPGPETGLDMLRRGILSDGEFADLVREGHTKVKYVAKFLAARNHVLSATTYAGLRLRGHITPAESYAGGALTGWDQEAMDKLWLVSGRPATTHQVHIGFARGGRNATTGNDERATFQRAVKESNIRDEWEPILWAQRYTYPSAFVLRALTQSGDLTAIETRDILLFSGWEPTLAEKVSVKWAGGTTAKADPYVTKADAHLWATTHRSYLSEEIDAATAQEAMTALQVTPSSQTAILALWDRERSLIRAQLTPAQVKKAYRGAILNRDTGQTWTRDDAVAALLERGYSANAANEFLDL